MNASTAEALLELADGLRPNYRGAEAKAAVEQLGGRRAELSAAMAWFAQAGRVDDAQRLALAMAPFWMAAKLLEAGVAQAETVLALAGGDDDRRGRICFHAGHMAFFKGDYECSAEFQHQAVALGRRTKNPTVTALGLVGLARIALYTDVEKARRLCREALAETEATDDALGRSHAMHVLGVAAHMAGDLIEAREVMSQRIAQARQAGDLYVLSSECGNLCMVERELGHLEVAAALAREALEIDHRTGNGMALPWKVNGLAAVTVDGQDFEHAAALIGIADGLLEAADGAWPPDELVQYKRTVDLVTGALGAAAFERARVAGRAMTTEEAVALALQRRASKSGSTASGS